MSRVRNHIDTEHSANSPDLLRALTATWIPKDAPKVPCAELDPSTADLLFFPTKGGSSYVAEAKSICATCPLTVECLTDALSMDLTHDHGVRGGTTVEERQEMRRKARRTARRAS